MGDYADLQFSLENEADESILTMLEEIAWGTTGILFRIKTIRQELANLSSMVYACLRRPDKTLMAVWCGKTQWVQVLGGELPALYQFLCAVAPGHQGRGLGKRLGAQVIEQAPKLLQDFSVQHPPRSAHRLAGGLLYCMIETDNARSLRMFSALGYQVFGELPFNTFARVFPKASPHIRHPSPQELEHYRLMLIEQNRHTVLGEFEQSLSCDSYWLMEDAQGAVIAGVQAEAFALNIRKMPGAVGFFALHILPHIPLIARLINPPNFRYVRFGNYLALAGDRSPWEDLLSAVLAATGYNMALIPWDPRAADHAKFIDSAHLGLARGLSDTRFNIVGLPLNMDAADRQKLSEHCFALSPLDN